MSKTFYSIVIVLVIVTGYFLYDEELFREEFGINATKTAQAYDYLREAWWAKHKKQSQAKLVVLRDAGCTEARVSYADTSCDLSQDCYANLSNREVRPDPQCTNYGATHIETPEQVKGIYMTSYAVGSKSYRDRLFALLTETELNTVVIDIKEVDGMVATRLGDANSFPFQEERMPNIKNFIEQLHQEDIYVIGRIVFFKDKAWAEAYPEHAIKKANDHETVWTDYGGKKYIDPGAKPFWDYLVRISERVYQLGFDEIQADYIRFPSDGDMANTYYPYSQTSIDEQGAMNGRVATLNDFAAYYTDTLRANYPEIVISADVFGMVTSLSDDLTIGQTLDPFLEHFDFVSPMVYPSHYPTGFVSLPGHPDNHPYEVVKKAMDDGVRKARVGEHDIKKLRPWLQDFTCTWCKGYFPYGAQEVREQIQATYDSGLDSWILWDAANRYSRGAFKLQSN